MTEIANCPFCGTKVNSFDVNWPPLRGYVKCSRCAYQTPAHKTEDEAIAAHNTLAADVQLARNLRKVTAEGHVQCGPGTNRKTFAAACLAHPNLIGVEIIRGRCAWNDTLDAALAALAKKIGPKGGGDGV